MACMPALPVPLPLQAPLNKYLLSTCCVSVMGCWVLAWGTGFPSSSGPGTCERAPGGQRHGGAAAHWAPHAWIGREGGRSAPVCGPLGTEPWEDGGPGSPTGPSVQLARQDLQPPSRRQWGVGGTEKQHVQAAGTDWVAPPTQSSPRQPWTSPSENWEGVPSRQPSCPTLKWPLCRGRGPLPTLVGLPPPHLPSAPEAPLLRPV